MASLAHPASLIGPDSSGVSFPSCSTAPLATLALTSATNHVACTHHQIQLRRGSPTDSTTQLHFLVFLSAQEPFATPFSCAKSRGSEEGRSAVDQGSTR